MLRPSPRGPSPLVRAVVKLVLLSAIMVFTVASGRRIVVSLSGVLDGLLLLVTVGVLLLVEDPFPTMQRLRQLGVWRDGGGGAAQERGHAGDGRRVQAVVSRVLAILVLVSAAGCGTSIGKTPSVPFLTAKGDTSTLISELKPGTYEASSLAVGQEKDLAHSAAALGRQREATDALERALRSPEPAPQIYEDVIVGYEKAGNITSALSWTDKASATFGGAPRWTPVKIRLLRKAGRTAEASTLMLSCSVNTPDWRRPCQDANQTPAGQARR